MTLTAEELSTRTIVTGDIQGRNRRRRRLNGRAPWWVGTALGLFCFLVLTPFIWMALSVTKPTDVAFANPPVLWGYEPTLKAPKLEPRVIDYFVIPSKQAAAKQSEEAAPRKEPAQESA